MAELELSVAYKARPARVGLFVIMGLMPIWAIIVPFCLGLLVAELLTHPVALLPGALLLTVCTVIPVACVVIQALCEDDRITVTREGISFPSMMLRLLKFRRERMWSDLGSAQLIRRGKTQELQLSFRSGGSAALRLDSMTKSDTEQLLLALEVWGQNCQRSDSLIEYQNQLQNSNRGIETVSYTQMWEEELSRRFSATSFVPLEPNKTLMNGRFKIVRQLAFGGLSAIYLAQQNNTELVIVKEAVVPASADEQSRKKAAELFEREARFLVRLDHPNIAKVYDHFAEEGRNYLILEYLRGQDLRQFVKQNGAQPEHLVVDWACQIASILSYLHSHDPPIIHRDLTPDNLVRKDDDSVVLIDFGAANEFVGTATGTLVGKQAYIAPEQLRGKACMASDIYALGGTIYYLVTGKDPEALSESKPSEALTVSPELDEIVAECTQLEPEDRKLTAEDLVLKLRALKKQLAASASPDPAEVAL